MVDVVVMDVVGNGVETEASSQCPPHYSRVSALTLALTAWSSGCRLVSHNTSSKPRNTYRTQVYLVVMIMPQAHN